LYMDNRLPWFRGELPNCLRLRVGTGSLEVRYPNNFIDVSYESAIRIQRQDSKNLNTESDEDYILGVDVLGFKETLDEIVGETNGPKYQKYTFSGYDAGFAHSDATSTGVWDYYRIPVNEESFLMFYHYSSLSADEKTLADKMLHSIKITTEKEDVKQARVEKCGINW